MTAGANQGSEGKLTSTNAENTATVVSPIGLQKSKNDTIPAKAANKAVVPNFIAHPLDV